MFLAVRKAARGLGLTTRRLPTKSLATLTLAQTPD